jgi:ubiquinone/menaquinone biosynthesis C-methylase UbiE
MNNIDDSHYDFIISTFFFCVQPKECHLQTINQFIRVLKPGGQFKFIEMVCSKNPKTKKLQQRMAPIVSFIYGARFDDSILPLLKKENVGAID